ARRRHPCDFVARALRNPHRPIRPGSNGLRARGRAGKRELRHGAGRRDPADLACVAFGEPQIAVRSGRDISRAASRGCDRKFRDRLRARECRETGEKSYRDPRHLTPVPHPFHRFPRAPTPGASLLNKEAAGSSFSGRIKKNRGVAPGRGGFQAYTFEPSCGRSSFMAASGGGIGSRPGSLAPLALFLLAVGPAAAQTPLPDPGAFVERALNGGEEHAYSIRLQPRQLLHLTVDQRGIDVVTAVDDSIGREVLAVDSQLGIFGTETLCFVADRADLYRIRVR